MKLAVVVQRYGSELNGGAELHARYVAEHLDRHHDVEVLTTCARDYITWRNEFPAGLDSVNDIPVRRFPVRRERNPRDFGGRSEQVFTQTHSVIDELRWLASEGPTSPALVRYLRRHEHDYEYFIFFSYRYYSTYHGIRTVPTRALLVPTAERDPVVGLAIFGAIFRGVRAIMYNSFEERALIQNVAQNENVPSVVVGVGSAVPDAVDPERFRSRTGITGPFALYIGRIDENKGCAELFQHYCQYVANTPNPLELVLIGNPVMAVPPHTGIRKLGFVSDETKFDALSAAKVLIMPSYLESLSMVTLEAWALGVPVLVNGICDVLRGQVVRSNAGLYYTNRTEFVEALQILAANEQLRTALGAKGRTYFCQHYTWEVVEQKYLTMLDRLQAEDREGIEPTLEPKSGWLDRRKRNVSPAAAILATVPSGPIKPDADTSQIGRGE